MTSRSLRDVTITKNVVWCLLWSYVISGPCTSHGRVCETKGSQTGGSLVWNRLISKLTHWPWKIVKQILVIGGLGISCEIALIWISLDFTDDQSALVQVMAWCRQATSHYLSQCWPRSLSPCGVTRPQWVNNTSVNEQSLIAKMYFGKSDSMIISVSVETQKM